MKTREEILALYEEWEVVEDLSPFSPESYCAARAWNVAYNMGRKQGIEEAAIVAMLNSNPVDLIRALKEKS